LNLELLTVLSSKYSQHFLPCNNSKQQSIVVSRTILCSVCMLHKYFFFSGYVKVGSLYRRA